jgi:hypothetical protein
MAASCIVGDYSRLDSRPLALSLIPLACTTEVLLYGIAHRPAVVDPGGTVLPRQSVRWSSWRLLHVSVVRRARLGTSVWCANPGVGRIRTQVDLGPAFWEIEPGAEG